MEQNKNNLADAKGSNDGYQCQKCKATTLEKRAICGCDGCKGLTFNILTVDETGHDKIIGKFTTERIPVPPGMWKAANIKPYEFKGAIA